MGDAKQICRARMEGVNYIAQDKAAWKLEFAHRHKQFATEQLVICCTWLPNVSTATPNSILQIYIKVQDSFS